ncbi:iron-containing alcohol dehydrogenase [Baekduia soli]|uniref:Iron-containing alcohol dehydrogenase n=2 Tax=Baekduia soli TaxID=496014 RepID=A0A5B8UCD7_9ACTN|nr:iron-containing alcohol dehydrogenase [Baekduia soli]
MTELRVFEMPRTRRVIQGSGATASLAGELDERGLKRAMLVTGRSVSAGEGFAALVESLGDRVVDVYNKVEAHNPVQRVVELIEQARKADADVFVAVGGGSPVDAAKLAALGVSEGIDDTAGLAEYAVKFEYPDIIKIRPQTAEPLPVIAVPTTLSAAEWDGFAGSVDHERDTKDLHVFLNLTPTTVVLDPALAALTPRDLWATTGVRALDHAVETAYAKNAHPFTTWLATGALGILAENLPRSVADADDHEAALQCQIAAWMSIIGVHNVSLGLSHGIGHQLGAVGIPHGVTSCIMLPHVMRFLEPVTRDQQAAMAKVLARGGDPSAPAADHMERLFDELGVPRRVSDFGVPREKMDAVAKATLGDLVVREAPRKVDEQVVYELLEKVW